MFPNMKNVFNIIVLVLTMTAVYSQNIMFLDSELKSYLINENTIDTNNDNIPDIKLDQNNDNEIQLSEALSITNLILNKYQSPYGVSSVQDLSQFANIEKLRLLYLPIENIVLTGLPNLTYLEIGSSTTIKHIDISNLTTILDLRIEDINGLEYLNIQNGNYPSINFSLFYTENILYACIDDITAEYDEVVLHMASGLTPSINCSLSVTQNYMLGDIIVFPNPTTGIFSIKYNKIDTLKLSLFDMNGKVIIKETTKTENLDISNLNTGVYFLKLFYNQSLHLIKKIIKK